MSIDVYVTLLDEGSDTLRPAKAIPLEGEFFQLLEPEDYDPEDEAWEFVPGSIVRLEEHLLYNGARGLVVKHPDPNVVRIFVECDEKHAPQIRETYALPLGEGLYKILPTPHYTSKQLWKFPPGSVVRLKKMPSAYPGHDYLLAY